MIGIGIMSGTSLDGVDIAIAKIENNSLKTDIKIIGFNTYEIPKEIKGEIFKACSIKESSSELICSLNFKLGKLFANCVKRSCLENSIDLSKVDFIASHGQTIYHIPNGGENLEKSTLQIGEASVIAYETGVTVISDFRTMDMAAKGLGAPLVPFSEYVIYGEKDKSIALQNIGGIGNVTFIPKGNDIDKIVAFDTGPGNMTIDAACKRLFNKDYDKDGEIARRGQVNKKLLNSLMEMEYIKEKPPKTTGRELFGERFIEKLLLENKEIIREDIIATLTKFTSESIVYNYREYLMKNTKLDRVIIGGGGAYNKTLINNLKESFKLDKVEVVTQEEIGHSSAFKEAIAFIILGNETLNGGYSNVPSATGAIEKVVLGKITLGKNVKLNLKKV